MTWWHRLVCVCTDQSPRPSSSHRDSQSSRTWQTCRYVEHRYHHLHPPLRLHALQIWKPCRTCQGPYFFCASDEDTENVSTSPPNGIKRDDLPLCPPWFYPFSFLLSILFRKPLEQRLSFISDIGPTSQLKLRSLSVYCSNLIHWSDSPHSKLFNIRFVTSLPPIPLQLVIACAILAQWRMGWLTISCFLSGLRTIHFQEIMIYQLDWNKTGTRTSDFLCVFLLKQRHVLLTFHKLKNRGARRKWKAAINAVRATNRMRMMTTNTTSSSSISDRDDESRLSSSIETSLTTPTPTGGKRVDSFHSAHETHWFFYSL